MGIFQKYGIPITLFILWIALSIINPIIQLKPWFTWFNDYDPNKQYRCFSVYDIANFKYNNLMYNITNVFKSSESKFKYDYWIYFIWGIMTAQGVHVVPNGICTPKTLCHSLIPSDYTSINLPGNFGRNWPKSKDDWKKLVGLWAGVPDLSKLTQDNYDQPDQGGVNMKKWLDTTKFPNNFLAKWGISPISPVVIGFLTGWTQFREDKLFPVALHPLLGITGLGTPAGGWFGYLQAGDNFNGGGLFEANRWIWSSEPPPMARDIINKQTDKGKKSCNAASITSGALGLGMGGAFAASAVLAPETGGLSELAMWAVAGIAAAASAIGGTLSAASQKCI
jgi:hypothetical protein